MIKLKLNFKKHITYILLFIITFSLSSVAMISVKKKAEERLSQVYSVKLSEVIRKNEQSKSSQEVAAAQEGIEDAVRALKAFSPIEIRDYQTELCQRIELYQKKTALLEKQEKEIDAYKSSEIPSC